VRFSSTTAGDAGGAEDDGAATGGRSTGAGGGGGDGGAGEFEEEGECAVAGGEESTGIDAALVAVGGIGHQSEAAGGAADGSGEKPCGFKDDGGGGVADPGRFAPHDAGEGDGAGGIGDDEVVGQERVGLVVEGLDFFPCAGAADFQDRAGELGGVEGVEGLAGLEEDEVGDVDDVVDRAMAGGGNGVLQPLRTGADLDVGKVRRGVKRTEVGGVEAGGEGGRCGREDDFRFGEGLEGACPDGGDFAGEAAVGEEVGAIRGDFQVEEGVAGHVLGEDFADGSIGREDEEAFCVVGEGKFFG